MFRQFMNAGRNAAVIGGVGLLLVACPSMARAQMLNPFFGYKGPTLTKEDLSAGSAAAGKLLNEDPPTIGQAESWVGPKSGNQGTLTIQRVFEKSGLPCRAIASRVTYKQRTDPREFIFVACRIKTGEWKLAAD